MCGGGGGNSVNALLPNGYNRGYCGSNWQQQQQQQPPRIGWRGTTTTRVADGSVSLCVCVYSQMESLSHTHCVWTEKSRSQHQIH